MNCLQFPYLAEDSFSCLWSVTGLWWVDDHENHDAEKEQEQQFKSSGLGAKNEG